MEPKIDPFEIQNPHYTHFETLERSFGHIFDASNFDLKKHRLPKSLREMSSTFRGPQLEEGGTMLGVGHLQQVIFKNILGRLAGQGNSRI